MSLSINSFISYFKGTNPGNLYQVTIQGVADWLRFYSHSTKFPGRQLQQTNLDILNKTITLKGSGGSTPNEFSITFYNDKDLLLRNTFIDWSNYVDPITQCASPTSQGSYTADITIDILSRETTNINEPITVSKGSIVLRHAFPLSISDLELDYKSRHGVTSTTVSFAYSHQDYVGNGIIGNTVNQAISIVDNLNPLRSLTGSVQNVGATEGTWDKSFISSIIGGINI